MALFPPIIDSSMPAFDINQQYIPIYFTNPELNNDINRTDTQTSNIDDDIQQIHMTLSYLSNNQNAFNSGVSNIINGIKISNGQNIFYDAEKDKYYVRINTGSHCNWQVDTLYKVQLRFSSRRRPVNEQNVAQITWPTFLKNYTDYFSEWSTVCIIKPIITPTVSISNITANNNGTISSQFADFNIIYNAGQSSQKLKNYQILIYKGTTLQYESQWFLVGNNKYTKDTNSISISKSLPYEFQTYVINNNGPTYRIVLNIKTENDYQTSVEYTGVRYTATDLNFSNDTYVATFINEGEGYIKIQNHIQQDSNGKFVLRRSSSKDNFLKWEDLYIGTYVAGGQNGKDYYYYDFTAQSGVAYRYMIQRISSSTSGRGVPKYDQATSNDKATIAEWEHAFLWQYMKNGLIQNLSDLNIKQLKLKFDLQLSSFNINIAESKTDTLGSKEPIIRRNGDMYYRSFPISGTIASQIDDLEFFVEKDILNDNQTALYENFKSTSKYYTNQYDYTYQRKFRQAVQQFLYNGKPKLYKSMQEGNILVRLMDISLTPKQQLGRLIYTFSATAYEIDEPTIDSYEKYNMLVRR